MATGPNSQKNTKARQRAQAKYNAGLPRRPKGSLLQSDGTLICKCGQPTGSKSRVCSPCAVIRNREHAQRKLAEGLSRSQAYNYSWREKNPKKYMLQNAKSSAAKRGLEFNITEEDFEIPEYCPVFGFKLALVCDQGVKDNKPSLDRIDSTKGYIKGNIQVISWRANNLKSNGVLEEFEKLVEFMRADRT